MEKNFIGRGKIVVGWGATEGQDFRSQQEFLASCFLLTEMHVVELCLKEMTLRPKRLLILDYLDNPKLYLHLEQDCAKLTVTDQETRILFFYDHS